MKKWLILTGLALVAVFPVRAAAEYAEARAETRVESNTGQVIINHAVSVATSGGMLQQREEIRNNVREKFQDLKQLWQEKLQQIKDGRKRTLLERVNNRICQLNQSRTAVMNQHLDTMEQILKRVETKAGELKSQGKDISSIESAIADARNKISEARAAVENQSGRVCTINITGDQIKLGQEVQTAVRDFGGELSAVHQKIKDARTAVAGAIQKLAIVLGVEVPPKIQEGE
jgi:uncharacterized coiled-coil DUF342 family protein